MSIEWVNERLVIHEDRQFKLFTAKHTDGAFYATLLYYTAVPAERTSVDDFGEIEFHHHTGFGKTEEEAMRAIRDWLDRELPNATVAEPTRREDAAK